MAYIFVIAFALVIIGLRIVNQYEKGIILTLGKFSSVERAPANML
jgi:regulator of protease activity HflC (stomatin/prohibitin superfamily)